MHSKATVGSSYGPMPRTFARFLNAGPAVWAKVQPQVPSGLRLHADASGTVPTGAFVDYLNWRRSLNPTRFDHYHPRVAGLLTLPPIVPDTPIIPPLTPAQPQVVPPPPLVPAVPQTVVPEPSSWMIGLGFIGAAVWVRRQRSRSTDLVE